LQQEVYRQVLDQIAHLDLATTQCLVLASEQWPAGILGLVAGQVTQQFGRPTVLLRIDPPDPQGDGPRLARGSARSVQGLDLYDLFKAQADLLSGFGGHPLAAGLTLPVEHVPMLGAALNRAVREKRGAQGLRPSLSLDLTVTVVELGQALFRELKLLEPYGMGNPVPRLLICNAWFERGYHRNLRDHTGRTVKFIKTEFELWDDTTQTGFPGEWWGHYKDELPQGRCDVVVELDHNRFQGYHIKLIDVRPVATALPPPDQRGEQWIVDQRQQADPITAEQVLPIKQIPLTWDGWQAWHHRAVETGLPLAIAYPEPPVDVSPLQLWEHLVGIAKYLDRTQITVTRAELLRHLPLTSRSLQAGITALVAGGFDLKGFI
jgi:single-stranded-DNA-specific exonuclease